METIGKRQRRTNSQIDSDIMNAMSDLVKEKGFANITLTGIAEKANIQPNVFYKRFENLESAIIHFIKQYDYWMNDLFQSKTKDNTATHSISNILDELILEFYDNTIMQRLIIWECSENNPHTKYTSQLRDANLECLTLYFMNQLKGDITINRATVALIIGGIYYLIIHRNASTFCDIDFSTQEGKNILRKAVEIAQSKLFEYDSAEQELKPLEIALKLNAEGVDINTIEKCTGIKKEQLL